VKVLHITNNDYDGAGLAVIRLHRALLDIGVDSSVALAFSKYKNKNVFRISYSDTKKQLLRDLFSFNTLFNFKKLLDILFFLSIRVSEKFLINYFQPKYLFNFNSGISRYKRLRNYIQNYDIIIFHSIQGIIFPH